MLDCALVDLGFTGDAMVHGPQIRAARQPDGSYAMLELFDAIAPWFSAPDLMMANLETTISGEELGYAGYPRFNSPPTIVDELKRAGVDLLQLANNHSMDRDEVGLLRTLDVVESRDLLNTGTFRDPLDRLHAAHALATLPGGVRVAVLAYTYDTNFYRPAEWWMVSYIDDRLFGLDIARARADGADLVVVGLHWGVEYRTHPEPDMVDLAHRLAGLGADVIWGHHPHVLQPAQVIHTPDPLTGGRDTLVLYSLGNLVSNQRPFPRDGGVVVRSSHLVCPDRAHLLDARFTPLWVDITHTDGSRWWRVVPIHPEGEPCPDLPHLDEDDCARMVRYRRHAAEILPRDHLSWDLEPHPLRRWTRTGSEAPPPQPLWAPP